MNSGQAKTCRGRTVKLGFGTSLKRQEKATIRCVTGVCETFSRLNHHTKLNVRGPNECCFKPKTTPRRETAAEKRKTKKLNLLGPRENLTVQTVTTSFWQSAVFVCHFTLLPCG